jgi:RND family efflux transporter MFP subunit
MDDTSHLLDELSFERPVNGKRLTKSTLFIGVLFALLACVFVYIFRSISAATAVKVLEIQYSVAQKAENVGSLNASGYVVARLQSTIAAQVTGRINEILFDEGQHVSRGQIIATLDDKEQVSAVTLAKAELALANDKYVAAVSKANDADPIFSRTKKLVQSHSISQNVYDKERSEFDVLQNAVRVAAQEVEVSKARLAVVEQHLENTKIKAPFSGIVTAKTAQPGEVVSPMSAGGGYTRTGICTVVDMDSLEVEVDVSENYINRINVNQSAEVRLGAYPDLKIPAFVVAVIPSADRAKATVRVRVGLREKSSKIVPEMGAQVVFLDSSDSVSPSRSGGVLIPREAVTIDSNSHQATTFVVSDNKSARRVIQLGETTGTDVKVISGLSSGDLVIVSSERNIKDGSRIKIIN